MDPTESIRRDMIATGQPQQDLADAKLSGQQMLSADEAFELYEFISFAAPYVVVRRKSDGKRGTMEFTHSPRVYFNFLEDDGK